MPIDSRTKVLATIGPSSATKEQIAALIDAGADAFRINFSHGTHAEHKKRIKIIRSLEKEKGRQLLPIMEEVSNEMSNKVQVCKMNVDEAPATPSTFGIRSIPSLLLFKDGKLVDTKVGLNSKSTITSWINDHA